MPPKIPFDTIDEIPGSSDDLTDYAGAVEFLQSNPEKVVKLVADTKDANKIADVFKRKHGSVVTVITKADADPEKRLVFVTLGAQPKRTRGDQAPINTPPPPDPAPGK